MKVKLSLTLIFFILGSTAAYCEEKQSSFGVGVGSIYNGFGLNYGIHGSSLYRYYSLGCYFIGYSQSKGLTSNCGIGYGIVVGNLLKNYLNHGVGLKLGVSYNKQTIQKSGAAYQLGVHYLYFFNGFGKTGWNVAFGPVFEHFNSKIQPIAFFGFGFQF